MLTFPIFCRSEFIFLKISPLSSENRGLISGGTGRDMPPLIMNSKNIRGGREHNTLCPPKYFEGSNRFCFIVQTFSRLQCLSQGAADIILSCLFLDSKCFVTHTNFRKTNRFLTLLPYFHYHNFLSFVLEVGFLLDVRPEKLTPQIIFRHSRAPSAKSSLKAYFNYLFPVKKLIVKFNF